MTVGLRVGTLTGLGVTLTGWGVTRTVDDGGFGIGRAVVIGDLVVVMTMTGRVAAGLTVSALVPASFKQVMEGEPTPAVLGPHKQ